MHSSHPTAASKNLRRLFWLRSVMIAFVCATALALRLLDIPLQLPPIAAAVGGMLLLNAVTWLRLRSPGRVGEGELLLQLLGDIATLSVLFYFNGGYSNPFVWMYLLPLAIAAVALRTAQVWLVAALAVACYSALAFWHVPLSHLHVHALAGVGLDIHLVGMWLGFVASAGMIAVFVARIGQNLREYDRLTAEAREAALESERMLALGTLAAGAAHELGTPLATMAVLARELAEEHADRPQLADSLVLLRQQIDRCKQILGSLAASAGQARSEGADGIALDAFLVETVQRWLDSRPEVQLAQQLQGPRPAPLIAADRTLGMALVNLLDNAADASSGQVELHGEWDTAALQLAIRDHGPGLTPEAAAQAGTPFFTTKQEQGMGLGLYLARMILGRYGGSVVLQQHPQGGTLARVSLPLGGLRLEGR